jgi:hypothetical protein
MLLACKAKVAACLQGKKTACLQGEKTACLQGKNGRCLQGKSKPLSDRSQKLETGAPQHDARKMKKFVELGQVYSCYFKTLKQSVCILLI